MSITRLQQARQMYAMGQRVAKTLDGSRPGYRGDDAARSSEGTSAGRADPGAGAGYGDGPSSSDRDTNTREDNSPQATGDSPPLQRATPMDVKEQYAVGTPTILGAPITPAATSPQLENIRNDNRIDALNLQSSTYKPINIPPFVPGGMILNTVGNFIGNLGYKKNTQFFADNVAGKYGYGYGLDAYKDYMKARQLGNVNAYGRPLTEGELRLRDGDSGGGGGIMDVTVNETIDETTDDTTNEDGSLILRYLHDYPNEVVNLQAMGVKDTDEMLQVMLDRAKKFIYNIMAKIVQTLTRASSEYEEDVAQSLVRDLDAVLEKLNTTFQEELKQEIEARSFFFRLMAVVNQYKFVGIDNSTTGGALTPLGSGVPAINETIVIKSILVTAAGTPTVTVTNNSITAIKSVALTANQTKELLTQPLIVEGGKTFTVQSSSSDSFDVAISYLNIKKEVTT